MFLIGQYAPRVAHLHHRRRKREMVPRLVVENLQRPARRDRRWSAPRAWLEHASEHSDRCRSHQCRADSCSSGTRIMVDSACEGDRRAERPCPVSSILVAAVAENDDGRAVRSRPIRSADPRVGFGVKLRGVKQGRVVLVALLLVLGSCGGDVRRAVGLRSVDVSADRLTLTIVTPYPLYPACAKLPAGVEVDVRDDVVVVAAYAKGSGDTCTLECGQIVQTVTLDKPLPLSVRFRAPDDADPGCG